MSQKEFDFVRKEKPWSAFGKHYNQFGGVDISALFKPPTGKSFLPAVQVEGNYPTPFGPTLLGPIVKGNPFLQYGIVLCITSQYMYDKQKSPDK